MVIFCFVSILRKSTTFAGKEAAMACTVAVEDTIVQHYTDQIREIVDTGREEEYKEVLEVSLYMSVYCKIAVPQGPCCSTIWFITSQGIGATFGENVFSFVTKRYFFQTCIFCSSCMITFIV